MSSESTPDPTKPTLLFVDDEDGPRQSLKVLFGGQAEVLLARNGEEAIEHTRNSHIDVAILDIRMPGMSGIEVLAALKDIDPHIEVVMLTAFETLDTARSALRLGAFDYLNKPFDIGNVREVMKRALAKRRETQSIRSGLEQLNDIRNSLDDLKLQEEIAREKGEIYASVLHDINGPLTIISAFVQMMSKSLDQEETVDASKLQNIKTNLSQITEQADRCVTISRRYLGFLRGDDATSAPVSINLVLTDLKELLRKHPAKKEHTLNVELLEQDERPTVNGTDIIQILLNLTINALQAGTQPHEVNIFAARLDAPLDLDAYPESDTTAVLNRDGFSNPSPLLAVTIADNASGISADIVHRIFEAYFTTKSSDEGTGLGLSIVSRLVKKANAAVLLQTEPGKGSQFTLFSPIDA